MTLEVHLSRHPVVQHKLALLRSRDTPPARFRALVQELSQVLFLEASQDLAMRSTEIHTPLEACQASQLAGKVALVPILRAGLGMAEAIMDFLPDACVWHLGLYRDHQTLQPVTYYSKLTPHADVEVAYVLDPMLATGGSALAALDLLKQTGVRRLKFIGLIAAPEGVQAMQRAHPEVPIHLAGLDRQLNEHGYIIPGLGDAGDRQFNTA